MTADKPLNLYQRIASLATKVGDIQATSQNQYQKQALGRGDIEKAIRQPLAEAGIVVIPSQAKFRTHYASLASEATKDLAPESAVSPGLHCLDKNNWQVTIAFRLVNVDEPTDYLDIWWSDTGSNPAAAISFTVKSFYKALLHLDDTDDEGDRDSARPASQPRRERPAQQPHTRKPQEATASPPPAATSSPPAQEQPAAKPAASTYVPKAANPISDIMIAMGEIAKKRAAAGLEMATLKLVKQDCLTSLGLPDPISELPEADLDKVREWIAIKLTDLTLYEQDELSDAA